MTPIAWLFLFVLAVEILLFIPLLLLYFFGTDAVKNRQLKKRAEFDYKNSRGASHRQFLEKANSAIEALKRINYKLIERTNIEIRGKTRERNIEIQKALVNWLVLTRLHEAHGIGEVTADQVYYGVFRGNFSDLRQSYTLYRIGPQKQYAINRWVDYYQERLPDLIREQEFPERQIIIAKHNPQIKRLEKNHNKYRQDNKLLDLRLKPIKKELSWLRSISVKNFINAYKQQSSDDTNVIKYCIGVYADWEPMPEWFKQEVGAIRN